MTTDYIFPRPKEQKEIQDVSSSVVPIQVVSVKFPKHWIIRAISAFQEPDVMVKWIDPFIRLQTAKNEFEWTQHKYLVPHYLAYGSDYITKWGWPDAGVYAFWYTGNNTYRNAERLI